MRRFHLDALRFAHHTIKIAFSSMDLFRYSVLLIQMFGCGILNQINQIIFDMSYYYFIYDFQCVRMVLESERCDMNLLNKYHNFQKTMLGERCLYRDSIDMRRDEYYDCLGGNAEIYDSFYWVGL